ncbi:DUF6886 family protein [Oceanobacillus kapialis]|uniref:DUF6886 family protein n=1 Tax=Oceanobacillus kapialis TaxID=481353 RepID=A0ABW5PYR2_9BACI
MKLFHVSEEKGISIFRPRVPERIDLDKRRPLVWAISEEMLPNFLTPRNCPRVCFQVDQHTSSLDKKTYLRVHNYVIVIEKVWLQRLKETTLYLYEFNSANFVLQDKNAGYYVSELPQIPIRKIVVENLHKALAERGVELRVVDRLW